MLYRQRRLLQSTKRKQVNFVIDENLEMFWNTQEIKLNDRTNHPVSRRRKFLTM